MNDKTNTLVRVGEATHTAHNAEDVVVSSVDAHLGSLGALNCVVGQNKLKSGIVDAGEVASSRWLVLLRAKCEREDVDTSVWVARVMLEWLNQVEVGTLTLREAILSVQLEFGGDNRVLTPAVHVEGSLGEDEDTGVRDTFRITSSDSNFGLLEKTGSTVNN